nr:OmpA family protein [Cytophagales bacterium]
MNIRTMMKTLTIIAFFLVGGTTAFGQLDPYNYRIGMGFGYTNYYGDLSPYRMDGFQNLHRLFDYNPTYIPDPSFSLSLERKLSRSLSIMASAGQYHLAMSDRYKDRHGNFQTDLPNFYRSLNFQTRIQDAGLSLVFRTDNDLLLNKNAFLAPYFTLNAGMFRFDVKGDLLNAAGEPYDYSKAIITNDNVYETDLRPLNTELDQSYDDHGFYYGLGIGFRVRIAEQVELFVQSDFKHSSTDYLDDVSGQYKDGYTAPIQAYAAKPAPNAISSDKVWRGDENRQNDWYMYHHAGIKISVGVSKRSFRASRVSTGNKYTYRNRGSESEKDTLTATADTLATTKTNSTPTNQYFNFFQLNPPVPYSPELAWRVTKAEEQVALLENEQALERNSIAVEQLRTEIDSLDNLENFWTNLSDSAEQDSSKLEALSQYRRSLMERVDSLGTQRSSLDSQRQARNLRLDSLNQVHFETNTGRGNGLDTTLFNESFRELYGHINGALAQDGNWRQLSEGIDERDIVYRDPHQYPRSRNNPTTSPSQNDTDTYYYSDIPYQPTYNPYTYDPGEQTATERGRRYFENQPADRSVESRSYRSNYSDQRTFRSAPNRTLERRSNTMVPIYIPGAGNRDRRSAAAPLQQDTRSIMPRPPLQSDSTTITGGDQIDRLGSDIPHTSYQAEKVDTFYVEKEIVIGLPNSKKEVYFGINQTALDSSEREKLQEVASIMEVNPAYMVSLSGYADNTGAISYNLSLVSKRVDHVKSLLIEEYQIPEERIVIKDGGLLVRQQNRGSRNEDRKVELVIYDPKPID